MGEPATKAPLSLAELEASGNLRTGRKHVLSILVENKSGVLTRIAGLFARRGFNIDTLAVGPTDDDSVSRITLTLDGAVHPIDQVTKQLHKLINVLKIFDIILNMAAPSSQSTDWGPSPLRRIFPSATGSSAA